MQILEILQVFVVTVVGSATCCSKKYVDSVSDAFDRISQRLTQLTNYQVKNIKFS